MAAVSRKSAEAKPETAAAWAREASPAFIQQQEVRLIAEWNTNQGRKRAELEKATAKMQETVQHITKDAVDGEIPETFIRWIRGPWRRHMKAFRAVEPASNRIDRYGLREKI